MKTGGLSTSFGWVWFGLVLVYFGSGLVWFGLAWSWFGMVLVCFCSRSVWFRFGLVLVFGWVLVSARFG